MSMSPVKRAVELLLLVHKWCFERGLRTPEVSVMTVKNPTDEFLRYAADCERMAKVTRDPASKATWKRMAERWLQCAERSKRPSVAPEYQIPAKPERKRA